MDAWVLSSDHKQLAYQSEKTYGIVDATKEGSKPGDGQLDLSKLKVKVDYHQEWAEMFDEAWRQERDYFYSPKMNGWIGRRSAISMRRSFRTSTTVST